MLTFKQYFISNMVPNFVWKETKYKSPRPGMEPGSPAWQAVILTTILSRIPAYILTIFHHEYGDTFRLKIDKIQISPTVSWTQVSRVTGGDTYHYTIDDSCWYFNNISSRIGPKLRLKIDKNQISPTGNWSQVSRMTGRNIYHFTIDDSWWYFYNISSWIWSQILSENSQKSNVTDRVSNPGLPHHGREYL